MIDPLRHEPLSVVAHFHVGEIPPIVLRMIMNKRKRGIGRCERKTVEIRKNTYADGKKQECI